MDSVVANPAASPLPFVDPATPVVCAPFVPSSGGVASRYDVVAAVAEEDGLRHPVSTPLQFIDAHRDRIGRVLSTCQTSLLGIHPTFLFLLDAATIKYLAWNSVFVVQDAPLWVCSKCGDLDVVHLPLCKLRPSHNVCLFCCGCYEGARSRDAAATAAASSTRHRQHEESLAAFVPRASTDIATSNDVMAFDYGALLVQESAIVYFPATSVDTYVVTCPVVKRCGRPVNTSCLPLPSWCDSDSVDSPHDADQLERVSLDSKHAVVVEMHPAIVNGVSVTVPVCGCSPTVADFIRSVISYPVRVKAPSGASGFNLLPYLVLELRRLLQQQDNEGVSRLSRDHVCCMHVRGLVSALDQLAKTSSHTMRDACLSRATAVDASVEPQCPHGPAEVAYLRRCQAYCVKLLNGRPGHTVAIMASVAFCCPGSMPACKHHKRRCEHLRSIADYVSTQRKVSVDFALGPRDKDDRLLLQVLEPHVSRSVRTPADAFNRLNAHSTGSYPLTLLRATPDFVREVNHENGWATELVPDSPSSCPKCHHELGPSMPGASASAVDSAMRNTDDAG